MGREEEVTEVTVLPPTCSGGPHGLGDPNDQTLRKVEKEILIPQIMRDKAKIECSEEVKEFEKCCKASSLAMVVKCQKENTNLRSCLERWYLDPEFRKLCTKEYLEKRSLYRLTGIKKSQKRKSVETM